MNLLGPEVSKERRAALSNELHVDADTPPTFLFHTDGDAAVPMSNATRFAEACRAAGVPVELHILPHDTHGVGMAHDITGIRIWPQLLLTWLSMM